MQKFLVTAFLCTSCFVATGQQVLFEVGRTLSSFQYKNSEGVKLQNLQSTSHPFYSIGYRKNVWHRNLFFNLNASYNNYGTKGSDVALDNYFEWELSYLGISPGLDYVFYKPGNFSLYGKASVSVEFLMKGTQTLNNQVFDLKKEEDFDSPYYFLRPGLEAQYKLSESVGLFAEYVFGFGNAFHDVQGDLKIHAHNFGIGILIDLPAKSQDTILDMPEDIGMQEQLQPDAVSEQERLEHEAILMAKEKEITEKNQIIEGQEKEIIALNKAIETKEAEVQSKNEVIATQEQEITELKDMISTAMAPFEKGISIHERDGKIYITLENDMLFQPGSWDMGNEGKEAVNALGNILAENPDVMVLIEGHTDDQPFSGKGNIKDNWDLSAKRATSVVELLRKNKKINPKNLTAAGRGEFDPIADNSTPEGRAKNRRIEVIITPQLKGFLDVMESEKNKKQ